MISNLKKLALGIMSVGGILVPLAVVASCGSTAEDVNLTITDKNNPLVTEKDLSGDNYKTLATLEKLFNGITASNFANVTATKEEISATEYVITLTANEGYTIGGQKTLKSKTFTLAVDVEMKAKGLAPYEIKAVDVDNDAFKSYATLQKLFTFDTAVVTEELINRALVVTMTPTTGNLPRTVTLTANSGFAVDGMLSLDSAQFVIPINYVIEKEATVPTDIKPSDIVDDKYKMWEVVSKLFTGADFQEGMLGNLNIELIEVTVGQTYQIKLTPRSDFYINDGLDGIVSDEFTVLVTNLTITNKTSPTDITRRKLEEPGYIQTIEFLNKLFDLGSLTQLDIDNMIKVEFNNISGSEYKIILTAKSIDFRINNRATHESNQFTIAIGIDISKIDPVMEEISTFDTAVGTISTLKTLKKLFVIDIEQSVIDAGLTVTFNESGDTDSITITAKTGYIINDGDRSIQSATFPQRQGITGTARASQRAKLNEDDINLRLTSAKTINNFFDDITQTMVANDLTVILNTLEDDFYTITLRANDDKLFLEGRTITSVPFQVNLYLNIVRISPIIDVPTVSDINEENLHTLETLSKLFQNFTSDNFDKVTVRLAGTSNNHFVQITAKPGYLLRNGEAAETTLLSDFFTPQP
ncbi:MAG: hypothetical protein ACRDCH_00105 [Metamycoplasmataceae bacterium]